MNEDAVKEFSSRMEEKLGKKYELRWEKDKKGVTFGWCKLSDAEDITKVSEIVAGFKGRIMTISSLIASANEKNEHTEIEYHFYFDRINCTVSVTLPGDKREISSITPILKSADWHEREMQDLFNIKLKGHPNPKRLFLDESIKMTDRTMIPLSEALNGASTNTLWERIMGDGSKEENVNE